MIVEATISRFSLNVNVPARYIGAVTGRECVRRDIPINLHMRSRISLLLSPLRNVKGRRVPPDKDS